jgi:hypothetical protein
LLNLAGASPGDLVVPGEEYVPATFTSINLPANLAAYRNLIFEPGADRALYNLRLAQLLACVHATELDAYARDLDSRITYWPPRTPAGRLWRAATMEAALRQTLGAPCAAAFTGSPQVFAVSGPLYYQWTVNLTDASHASVIQVAPQSSTVVNTYSIVGGLSTPVPLTHSNLSLIFPQPTPPFPISWSVTALARPLRDIGAVLAGLNVLGTPNDLFGGGEPFATFRSLWLQLTVPAPHRLAAWVLALGYRLQAVYQSGGQ